MNLIYSRTFFVLAFLIMFATESRAQTANFDATPKSGCAPLLVAFSDLSTGSPTNYNWDFGDGTANSSLATPQHNYATPGQYTVTLTVSAGGSSNTAVKTNFITVFAGPNASFTIVPDTVCSGTIVTLTSTSIPGDGAITDFTWTFNDGNPPVTSSNPSITHAFNNGTSSLQVVTPVLLINDANGCNSTFTGSVYVFPAPNASFALGSNSSCTIPATISFTNASTGTSTFNWDFGDPTSGANNSSQIPAPSHLYNDTGSYVVTLTAGVPGCNSIQTMTVDVFPPMASFTADDSTICKFTAVNFTNTSVPTNATLQWNFGDLASGSSNFSTLPNPAHFYTTPATYTVTLTVTSGICTSTHTMQILVRPNPLATFNIADFNSCSIPFTATFTDTVSNIASWNWTFGDPSSGAANTSTLQNPTHTYNQFGPYYNVKLVVVDIYGCSDSINRIQAIQVEAPTVNFTQMDSGCVGSTFNFLPIVSSPANPNITNYVWNFGDGTGNITGTAGQISHQFNTVGIFDVTLTITTSDGCTASLTQPGFIRVGTRPVASFTASPLTICFQQRVQFTDLTAAPVTGWQWSFGDGSGTKLQNPNWEYKNDTSLTGDPFDVTLTAYYNGCPDDTTIANLITVKGPIPFFSFVNNCATPLTVPFTNLSGGATSYVWNYGDLSPTETTISPTHTFPASGDYNVTLTATSTATGCTVDTILTVRIRVASAVITANPLSLCSGGTISFSSAGSADVNSLRWTFGEGIAGVFDTSYAANPSHLYSRPGFYTVTLKVTDLNNCEVIQTQQVHILGPTAAFTASPRGGCAPINVTFTDASLTEGGAITQWVWNYGDGTANETTLVGLATHPYTNSGLFSVRLTVTDANGCTSTHLETNYINPSRPIATLPSDTGCVMANELFAVNDGDAGLPASYTWDFGDGTSPVTVIGDSTTTHNFAANGLYSVNLLLVDANGCRDSTTSTMFIYTTPSVFSLSAIDSCVTENGIKKAQVISVYHVDSTAYAASYDWDLTVKQEVGWTQTDYHYTYNVPPGSYDATLITTNIFGCKDTSTKVGAVVVAGPTGSFSFTPNNGCSPLTVNFTGVALGASTYAWDFDDGNTINGTTQLNVSNTYYNVDVYTPQFYLGFQLTNSFCYIPTPITDSINVSSSILANIDSSILCIPDGGQSTVAVSVNSQAFAPYTYTWTPSSYVTAVAGVDTAFTIVTSGQSQYYRVSVAYGILGCAAYDSVRVDYCECLDKIDSIPNVFTPNGDVKNDFFEMRSLCYYAHFRIIIFNRWGKKMYESTNPYFKWDGRTDGGTECSEGTYYWIMDTKSGQLHGYLELIRK